MHRTLDSIGAFLGPIAALGVLALSAQSFDAVFVASFCIAAFGVLVLVTFVRDRRAAMPPKASLSLRSAAGLLRDRPTRALVLAACVLGLVTVGEGFVYLMVQQRADIDLAWFPVLAIGTNLAYLALAVPLGVLADRIGRRTVMLGGYAALAAVYLLVFGPVGGWPMLVLVLGLHGVFYAATDGVLMALAGPVDRDDATDGRDRPTGREQPELGDRRDRVSEAGNQLAALGAVGDVAADQPQQRGRAGVQAVDEAVGRGREAEPHHQVDRQHRRHHLRGDVGDQADRAEGDHVGAHPAAHTGCSAGAIHSREVHGQPRWAAQVNTSRGPADAGSSRS